MEFTCSTCKTDKLRNFAVERNDLGFLKQDRQTVETRIRFVAMR